MPWSITLAITRVQDREEPPFTHTGVDFAGPIYVKASIATTSSKVWICLYTCCAIRALHLDVIPDWTTLAFIQSLKHFEHAEVCQGGSCQIMAKPSRLQHRLLTP